MKNSINEVPFEIRSGIEIALNELPRIRPGEQFNASCEMLDLDATFDSVKAGKLSRICTTVACEGDLPEEKRVLVHRAAIYTWAREQMPVLD